MEAGGLGLSSGLYYAPGSYATTEEVIALARVASEFGGVYSSHIRDEADYSIGVVASVQEVIRIAEEARLPGVVSHMKALGPAQWGLAVALTTRIEQARARGVQVYADQYPYEASGTGLSAALVPRWAQVDGREEFGRRLAGADRERIKSAIAENIDASGRPRHAGHLRLRARPRARRQVPGGDRGRARSVTPSIWSSPCSRRATAAWCRSTCPSATSRTSCGSRGR